MDELDKKLARIIEDNGTYLRRYGDGLVVALRPEKVIDIKQAFIDAGWVQVPQVTEITNTDPDSTWEVNHKGFRVNGKVVMTGQEWYDRFYKEMPRAVRKDLPLIGYEARVVEAAKKAAGFSDE